MKKLFVTLLVIAFSTQTLVSQPEAIEFDEIEESWDIAQNPNEWEDFDTAFIKVEVNKLDKGERKIALLFAGISILVVPLFLLITGFGYRKRIFDIEENSINLGEMAMNAKPLTIFQDK